MYTNIDNQKLDYKRLNSSLDMQNDTLELLSSEIETMKSDHTNQLARKKSQLEAMRESIAVTTTELTNLLDGADEYDLQQQRNLVQQAAIRLEQTKDQQDDYQIVAEFDGRVRTVDIVSGEQFKLDERKYIVVENPNLIELEMQISQIDIVKIQE
jgi:hypothetical protein